MDLGVWAGPGTMLQVLLCLMKETNKPLSITLLLE